MRATIITSHACEYARQLADAYIDNELLPETSLRIANHLQRCEGCLDVLARRRWMKARIRESVRAVIPPRELEAHVRARLGVCRQGEQP